MGRTKAELEEENRQLRGLVGEVYDRVADYVEPETDEADEDEDEDEDEFVIEDEE